MKPLFAFASAAVLSALLFNTQLDSVNADAGTPFGWFRCPNDNPIRTIKGWLYNGYIARVRAECEKGAVIEYNTGVAGQQAAQSYIQAQLQDFQTIIEWHDSKGDDGPLACLQTPSHGQINYPKGKDFPRTCGNDKVICGFRGRASKQFIQQMEWACCDPKPGVHGDPQFIGFMGQSFQVHGMDNTVYSIISTPQLQFNALFTYLNKGECREGTLCFSHPGNYFGKVGISIKSADNKVRQLLIEAGPVKEGMKVKIDGAEVFPSQKHLTIDSQHQLYFPSAFECYVETPEFSLKFENSDMFINQQLTVNNQLMNAIKQYKSAVAQVNSADNTSEVALTELPHGILGQTWQRKQYENRWKYIEGQLYDYIVSDGLNGNKFKFNRFDAAAAAAAAAIAAEVEITQP